MHFAGYGRQTARRAQNAPGRCLRLGNFGNFGNFGKYRRGQAYAIVAALAMAMRPRAGENTARLVGFTGLDHPGVVSLP